jgi:hypothetical protein
VSPDAGPLDIDPRIPARQLLHAGDLIGNRVVPAHRAVVRVLERLRPASRAHPVDRDDDEAELHQGLTIAARRREGAAAGAAGLRTGMDSGRSFLVPHGARRRIDADNPCRSREKDTDDLHVRQFAATLPPTTRPATAGARNDSARA